jgi:hypothetical protein
MANPLDRDSLAEAYDFGADVLTGVYAVCAAFVITVSICAFCGCGWAIRMFS